MENQERKSIHWFDKPLLEGTKLTIGTTIFIAILVLALVSRFYDLGARTISHDETSHVYYSWRLYKGMGYAHTPLTHGPFQFHLLALSYFFFGDNDFTARIPAAVFSVLAIVFLWKFKRYLGKTGMLATSALLLISPYMLYYGRYVRNEAFVIVFGIITIWAILRYLETGEAKYTFWLTAATTLHYTTKETAFIYTAQAMIFLGMVFVVNILRKDWKRKQYKNPFIIALIVSLVLLMVMMGIRMYNSAVAVIPAEGVMQDAAAAETGLPSLLVALPLILSIISALLGLYFAIRGLLWENIRENRAFGLLVLLGSFVLPQLTPFPMKMLGMDPTNYDVSNIIKGLFVFIPIVLLSIAVGLLWNTKVWLINAGIFYIPFTLLYTTFLTNVNGFVSGIVGSLGYWLEQQGVKRGNQPWYYYIGLQIPIYEYLPALGTLTALWIYLKKIYRRTNNKEHSSVEPVDSNQNLFVPMMFFWTITSGIAYSIAGEKMPWLTCHIALPMIFLAGWAIGKLFDNFNWRYFTERKGILTVALVFTFVLSLSKMITLIIGATGFDWKTHGENLASIQVTGFIVLNLIVVILSGWALGSLINNWDIWRLLRNLYTAFLVFLAVLTARTAAMAAYINYNNPTEYLVYAHMARGPKEAFEQIKELSRRTTDGLSMEVAYDDETTYPYWWYLRNFTTQNFYGDKPTRELRKAPVILVGNKNYGKIEPVVGNAYYKFDYIRIWWPNQDYFNLTYDRIVNAITNPDMREALFRIWFFRDYAKYAELTGQDLSLENWTPSVKMRLYVRKDIASKVWNLANTAAEEKEIKADPYEGKGVTLVPDKIVGTEGKQPGEFVKPRNVAVASDGSLYVADSGNNRIQHLSPDGDVIKVWGKFGDISTGDAPPGTFYEPWGIAVDSDNNVYVADTWNHRIQKFDANGNFITQWGTFGQAENSSAFWGPRDILVDSQDRIFVTDTGNKRIVIFDKDGNFLSSFGTAGLLAGEFDEPVGIALDGNGRAFVADTWNQRIQRFVPSGDGLTFTADHQWEISGWYGQSLDNKPYIAVDRKGHLFASDPEGYRILEFDTDGKFIRYWGDYGDEQDGLNLPTGMAIDSNGGIWVADAGNNRLLHFITETGTK